MWNSYLPVPVAPAFSYRATCVAPTDGCCSVLNQKPQLSESSLFATIDSHIIVRKASFDVGDIGLFFKHLKEDKGVGKIDNLFNTILIHPSMYPLPFPLMIHILLTMKMQLLYISGQTTGTIYQI